MSIDKSASPESKAKPSNVFIRAVKFAWNIRLGPALGALLGLTILVFVIWSTWIYFRDPGGRDFISDDSDVETIVEPDAKAKFEQFRTELDSTKDSFFEPITVPLARLCDGIYGDEKTTVPRTFFNLRFDSVEPAVAGSQAAMIGSKEDVIVVVFRGTNEIKDWYFNTDIRLHPSEHGNFHRGFWDAYAEVRKSIVDKIKQSKPKYVWITGHSLGGAMAMCCAYDLEANEGIRISGLVTFGQPKLADIGVAKYFSSGLSSRYLAFINDRDPICEPAPGCYPCGNGIWLRGNEIELANFIDILPVSGGVGSATIPTGDFDSTEYFFKMMPKDVWQQKLQTLQREDSVPLTGLPPGARRTGSPWRSVLRFELPYISDHSMKRYIAKLEQHHYGNRAVYSAPVSGSEMKQDGIEDISINY